MNNNRLAKLDEESDLKITGNLPVLDGATALCPVYASFAQAVYPEGDYNIGKSPVLCSRTDKAYENLLEGKADIIFCAQPSEMQINRFHDTDIHLKLIEIGREAFVFFVNRENPADNVTVEDIQGIYSGEIKNWKKINGMNKRIRAFQRPKNSGSQTALEKIMGDIPLKEARRENVSEGMGGIINEVATYRNFPDAIGYSFLHFSTKMVENDQIKLLSVNGIYPSKETIQDGTYPFAENFYAIYIDSEEKNQQPRRRADGVCCLGKEFVSGSIPFITPQGAGYGPFAYNENIEPFIEWILSAQGQELVQKTGYLPLKRQIPVR